MTAGQLIFAYVSINAMLLLLPFIFTFSLGWGLIVTTRIMLLREYFGRGNFGKILGFFFGVIMVGVLTGPPVAGWVFDTWSSYQGAWLAFSIITLVGAALVFTMPTMTVKY